MKSFTIVVVALASTLIVRSADGAEITIPVTSAQLVTAQEGGMQIVLPMTRPEVLEHVSLGEARLQLSEPLEAERELRIHVLALSASYSGGGDPPVYEGLVGRLNVDGATSARSIDLANLVRGVLDESQLHGLLLTPAEGADRGFGEEDAQALLSVCQGATLSVSFRAIPPPPRGQRS